MLDVTQCNLENENSRTNKNTLQTKFFHNYLAKEKLKKKILFINCYNHIISAEKRFIIFFSFIDVCDVDFCLFTIMFSFIDCFLYTVI